MLRWITAQKFPCVTTVKKQLKVVNIMNDIQQMNDIYRSLVISRLSIGCGPQKEKGYNSLKRKKVKCRNKISLRLRNSNENIHSFKMNQVKINKKQSSLSFTVRTITGS